MWEETALGCIEVLCWQLPGGTEETTETFNHDVRSRGGVGLGFYSYEAKVTTTTPSRSV